jgi:ParB family chromosome partitioning protein
MNLPPKARGLGRGLSALLGDDDVAATVAPSPAGVASDAARSAPASRTPFTLPIAHLRPGRFQPRTVF